LKTPTTQYTSIGGQAVIEGVMMRSPNYIAVAVRKADRTIMIRNLPYSSVVKKIPLLRKPVFRGVTVLLESMVQGIGALSYSANIAAETLQETNTTGEKSQPAAELSSLAIAGSIATAMVLGIGLFVVLPHLLTAWITSRWVTADSPVFHLFDGTLKITILLTYVYLIAMMKDIHRVFQYHGAEHKSIYAFEAGEELIVENARRHTTLHPRCGTSFLLFLVLISVAVFSIVFPLFGLTHFSQNALLNHLAMIVVKIFLMFPVAGLAYEFIKACALRMDRPLFKMMIWPGLMLQKLTTKEPDDDQLEVALASLRQVLRLEKGVDHIPLSSNGKSEKEIQVSRLSELTYIPAPVVEFPEM
jgi:uncharacterized protein YqhQ